MPMETFADKVATKLAEEIGKLARGQKKITPRQLLKRFGFARRNAGAVSTILAAFESAGIACHPPFQDAPGLDDALLLSLTQAPAKTPAKATPAPIAAPVNVPVAQILKAATPVAPTAPAPTAPAPTAPAPTAPAPTAPAPTAPAPTAPAPTAPTRAALSPQQIIGYAQQATVLICVENGHGSGFVVERAGLVATARHVVGEAREVEVFLADGAKCQGQVLYSNATLDFALVKVPPQPLAFNLRGEVEAFPGQRVFAIGSPRDRKLAGSVTAGIVSNTSRVEGGVEYLQTDTSISPGNSGGPLIAEDGTVIGMCVWGRSDGPGLNFALPASYLGAALEWLKPQLGEIESRVYCASCGFLNAPERWIECKTWICCGNCGTMLAEVEPQNAG